jgi:hypothetical protein
MARRHSIIADWQDVMVSLQTGSIAAASPFPLSLSLGHSIIAVWQRVMLSLQMAENHGITTV